MKDGPSFISSQIAEQLMYPTQTIVVDAFEIDHGAEVVTVSLTDLSGAAPTTFVVCSQVDDDRLYLELGGQRNATSSNQVEKVLLGASDIAIYWKKDASLSNCLDGQIIANRIACLYLSRLSSEQIDEIARMFSAAGVGTQRSVERLEVPVPHYSYSDTSLTTKLSELDGSQYQSAGDLAFLLVGSEPHKEVLRWMETSLKVFNPTWASVAVFNGLDWQRALSWLSQGRPLSLVALSALADGIEHLSVGEEERARFSEALENYLEEDNTPRVRRDVAAIRSKFKLISQDS